MIKGWIKTVAMGIVLITAYAIVVVFIANYFS